MRRPVALVLLILLAGTLFAGSGVAPDYASWIILQEQTSVPTTPASGNVVVYVASDSTICFVDDAGARFTLNGRTGTVDLTDNVSSELVTVTLADGEVAAGQIFVSAHADDGTDYQCLATRAIFTAVDKAGTVSASVISGAGDDTDAESAGTIATSGGSNGFSVTTGANTFTILIKINTSLTATGFHAHVRIESAHEGTYVFP